MENKEKEMEKKPQNIREEDAVFSVEEIKIEEMAIDATPSAALSLLFSCRGDQD